MNNLTATRIVKSVLQRTAEFDTYRYDYVRAPRAFYERLAEARALAGQWAEPHALELFAALSPAQRAIHIVMDDDEISDAIMRSTVVARQRTLKVFNQAGVAADLWRTAGVLCFVPDDPVDHLSQEELVAAFLEDDSLTIVSPPACADFTDEQWDQVKIATGVSQNEDDYRWTHLPDAPDLVDEDDSLSRDDLSMHFFGFGETSSGMTGSLRSNP